MADDRSMIDVDDPRTWPSHVHRFIEPFVELGLNAYDCDIFYRDVVPGVQIVDIWQPGAYRVRPPH